MNIQFGNTVTTFGSRGSSAREKQRLLLACFPKSGSSFLALALASLPGFRRVSLVPDFGRREAELSFHRLAVADQAFPRFVAKHHLRFSQETKRLIEAFALQPIVLVRNLFDVVASIRDQIKREAVVMAQAYVPPDAPHWENRRLEEFIASMILPWYLNFFASWTECPNRVQVTYEELVNDPFSTVQRLRDELRIDATDAEVNAAVARAESDPVSTRFNVGVCGRGKHLAHGAMSRILQMASYYSFLDLSSLGLSEANAATGKLPCLS